MKCKFGKPLTDDEISMLLDGQADIALEQHMEECPFCQQRVNEARQTEQALKAQLYRQDCPSSLELGNYNMGMVSPEVFQRITQHLTQCAACKDEFRILRDFLNESDLSVDAAHTQGPIIDFPISDPDNIIRPDETYFLAQQVQMVAQHVRGRKRQQYRYRVAGIELLFNIQESSKGLALEGLLLEPDDTSADWVDSLVEVWTDGELAVIGRVESDGAFRCDPIAQGVHEVRIIARSGKILAVSDVEVEG